MAAIRRIAAGGAYVSPRSPSASRAGLQAPGAAPHTLLSDREYQVLQMIAGGGSVSEIAERLSLCVKTVSTHKTRIFRRWASATRRS